jgi:hypothetical protein
MHYGGGGVTDIVRNLLYKMNNGSNVYENNTVKC